MIVRIVVQVTHVSSWRLQLIDYGYIKFIVHAEMLISDFHL